MTAPVPAADRWNRVRLVLGKRGRLRFLGHLDLARTVDRALRRTGLEFRFSEGFNPRVRVSFPLALAVGTGSECELAEVQVAAPAGPGEVARALGAELPADLPVLAAEAAEAGERLRPLEAEYRVVPAPGAAPLPGAGALASLLSGGPVRVERRGKEIDLGSFLVEARAEGDGLLVRFRFGPDGSTARPEDLLRALGADPAGARVVRSAVRVEVRRGETREERRYGA